MLSFIKGFFLVGKGQPSSKRLALVVASVSMSIAVVILAAAFYAGHDTAAALAAVCVPLAGLAGGSYVADKHSARNQEAKKDNGE